MCGCKDCFGEQSFAPCVKYQTELPVWSDLKLQDCVTIADTTEELYSEITALKTEVDLSDLTSECFTILEDEDTSKVTIKTFAQTVINILEGFKCPAEGDFKLNDIDIREYGLDFKCLEDVCSNPKFPTLSSLLQVLISKACAEDTTPQVLINTGAVDLTSKITHLTTTIASTGTLASGREGQEKLILMTIDGGNFVLAVPTLSGGTSITFDAVDDLIKLVFTAGKWRVLTNLNCVIA